MANVVITQNAFGPTLNEFMQSTEIVPGSQPGYQLCKTLYTSHPLGRKMAMGPVAMAQSQSRTITIPDSPEEHLKAQFLKYWKRYNIDFHIRTVKALARAYGISSTVWYVDGEARDKPSNMENLHKKKIIISEFDPLNTSGSLVLNQEPNSPDFQKASNVTVSSVTYHASRVCIVLNEEPIYIAYSPSAFGFVGRSVYQRVLYPLKSFLQTMITDDMVSRKAGLLIAKVKPAGSIADRAMAIFTGVKRSLLKEAQTDQVLSIDPAEDISSLNLQNVNDAMTASRKNILENVAAGADMPASWLNNETFAEGFGEGTEDAKKEARFVDLIREEMVPIYSFFDDLIQHVSWNRDYYATIQRLFPQYKEIEYEAAFAQWKESFNSEWPSLLIEPESKQAETQDVKLKAVIAILEVLLPEMDPESKTALIMWAADCMNSNKVLFDTVLNLDPQAMQEFFEEKHDQQQQIGLGSGQGDDQFPQEPKPEGAST